MLIHFSKLEKKNLQSIIQPKWVIIQVSTKTISKRPPFYMSRKHGDDTMTDNHRVSGKASHNSVHLVEWVNNTLNLLGLDKALI